MEVKGGTEVLLESYRRANIYRWGERGTLVDETSFEVTHSGKGKQNM